MIGVIWNCREVAKKGRGNCIKDPLIDFKADFIELQETINKDILKSSSELLIPMRYMPGTGCPLKANLEGSYVKLK
jgi:hypothetical protein